METEDGASNADNADQLGPDRSSDFEGVNNGVTIDGGNGVAEGEDVWGLQDEDVNNGLTNEGGNDVAEGEEVQGLKNETVNNEVVIEGGNGVVEGEEVCVLKNEVINNGVVIANGNGVAEGEEVLVLKNEVINNGVAIAEGNGVAEDGEIWGLKIEAKNIEEVVVDGNGVADSGEVQGSKNEAVNNEIVIANGNCVAECEEGWCLKNGKVDNGLAITHVFGVAAGNAIECFRTYKRRKHVKSSSESKVQGDSREYVEAASHPSDQEPYKADKDGQECSSQFECMSHRLQSEANGHANVMHNGFSRVSDGCGATERCQRVLCNILASEKFNSSCKLLHENFQGMKTESVFDFSVINSRMKGRAYEQSPTLFLSDIQQVWRKFQNTGNQIVAIAKSLSNMSKASFCEQFCNQESKSHMKPEQKELCATYKIGSCRHCGDKADGTDCLVCDSCEEMYHVSCIEPTVKEIPHKSWFCSNCTASGIGSRHESCVVCDRLNAPKTLIFAGEESIPTNEETLNELEENSNCTCDGVQVSIGERNSPDCKICKMEVVGEKIKVCGHPFCPNKYYHVRCLSSKQIKSYGRCWYCPSCLCQVCLTDKDDDKIVLCDGCDHAYHIYCMKPPRNSIPKGKWFCRKCDAGIQAIRQARKAYEMKDGESDSKPNDIVDKKWNNKRGRESDKVGGMDMLLTAANTLNFEEDLNAIQIDSEKTLT